MEENLFIFVVSFFTEWGWQVLGKVPNPLTGKTEKNLVLARRVIDILGMLQQKTQNNLTKDEERVISAAIAELQLNYVDEAKKERISKEGGISDNEQKESSEKTE
ncbi:MAG: DUF1844 domain-containing protein [Elusimicrobia bacterium]|jgi:hypothetical protein|nr:DUF1844 domain-containing protein [Elusimicrobiota bacterium]